MGANIFKAAKSLTVWAFLGNKFQLSAASTIFHLAKAVNANRSSGFGSPILSGGVRPATK